MPKVKLVKAGKDYPQFGIKKGEEHYVWAMKRQRGGVVKRSKERPRPSQLTENSFHQPLYSAQEAFEDALASAGTFEDLTSAKDDYVSALTELSEEQDEKFNNMPEGLQQGETGQKLENRRDETQSMVDELEGVEIPDDNDVQGELGIENVDDMVGDKKDEFENRLQSVRDELSSISYNGE